MSVSRRRRLAARAESLREQRAERYARRIGKVPSYFDFNFARAKYPAIDRASPRAKRSNRLAWAIGLSLLAPLAVVAIFAILAAWLSSCASCEVQVSGCHREPLASAPCVIRESRTDPGRPCPPGALGNGTTSPAPGGGH